MAKVSIGSLAVFNHEVQDWRIYKDRLSQWFLANDLTDTEDKSSSKRRAVLLSSLAENTYKLVRDLALPKEVGTLTYKEVVDLIDDHFKITKCGFAERHKFHTSTQLPSEGLASWAARVRGLALHCDFTASYLEEALRDRFVLGMIHGPPRDQLFTMDIKKLTLSKALEVAEGIKCAREGAAATQSGLATPDVHQVAVLQVKNMTTRGGHVSGWRGRGRGGSGGGGAASSGSAPGSAAQRQVGVVCPACGYPHHISACRFTKYKCDYCGVKGHLRKMCPQRKVRLNYVESGTNVVEGDEEFDDGKQLIFSIRSCSGEPMQESVLVNKHRLCFEVDTGSAVTLIPNQTYGKYFSDLPLNHCDTILQSYTGSKIECMGTLSLPITFRSRTKTLKVYVVRGPGPALLGRDFISSFGLQLQSVKSCHKDFLAQFIVKHPNLFSDGLGRCKDVFVDLKLKPNSKPIYYKARPVPFALKKKIDDEIERLVNLGIIEPIKTTQYASPVVPVLKQNGKIRLCADYSVTLNKQLEVEKYPLPRIEDLFTKIHGGKQFSKLDLSQAYNQLVLNESSQMLTSINTHKGLFKFTRLVFGLSSAAAIFQRTIESLLAGIDGVLIFQDDILITGNDETQHLSRLSEVFTRLENAGLVLQKEKCSLFQDSVSYLGYIIDRHGLHKSPEKVNAITNAKTPTNTSELKSFLGLVNYYRGFVENASTILYPLHKLLEKNTPWIWTNEHDQAVLYIKQELASDRVLAHYNPDAKLVLTVDASPFGLGAVLSQVEDNKEKPISFASRSLSQAEKNYSQIQKEATAIIYGVRKFHQYLYGRAEPFVLRTDHKPLLSIFNPHKGIPAVTANRLQRYAIFLSSYNFILEYVKSSCNVADFLSRSVETYEDSNVIDGCNILDKATYVHFIYDNEQFISLKNITDDYASDPTITEVIKFILNGWPLKVNNKSFMPYFSCRNELALENGCLVRGHRVVIPMSKRDRIIKELHVGHLGSYKIKSDARNRFWWPGMSQDIDNYIGQCNVCNSLRPSPPRVELTPWPYPPQPWHRVHLDLLGPIYSKTYLIIVDAYSKWIECYDVSKGYSTRTIIEKLCDVMARFGLIHTVVSDNGTYFVSEEFTSFCLHNGITHLTSPTYNPISNGQAESYVKIIKRAIKSIILAGYTQRDINCKLNEFLLQYRNSIHSTTGRSPAEILFGQKLRNRLDLIKVNHSTPLDATLDKVVKQKQSLQCKWYPGNRKVDFGVDEVVLVRVYKNQKPIWMKGVILQPIGNSLFQIKLCECGSLIKKHKNQLLKLKGEEKVMEQIDSSSDSYPPTSSSSFLPPIVLAPCVGTSEEEPCSDEEFQDAEQPVGKATASGRVIEPHPLRSTAETVGTKPPPPALEDQSSNANIARVLRPRTEIDYRKFN